MCVGGGGGGGQGRGVCQLLVNYFDCFNCSVGCLIFFNLCFSPVQTDQTLSISVFNCSTVHRTFIHEGLSFYRVHIERHAKAGQTREVTTPHLHILTRQSCFPLHQLLPYVNCGKLQSSLLIERQTIECRRNLVDRAGLDKALQWAKIWNKSFKTWTCLDCYYTLSLYCLCNTSVTGSAIFITLTQKEGLPAK